MFFPKLRRKAKWVFLLLAVIFGGGFLVFGVGTGGGSGIGDFLSDFYHGGSATGNASIDDLRSQVQEDPRDATAVLSLANALQQEGRTGQAIAELERYTALEPRDADALQQLASLYDVQALEARQLAIVAQSEAQESLFGQTFAPGGEGPLAQALGQDPIGQALAQRASDRANAAFDAMRRAYRQEAQVYQQLTLLTPEEPFVFLQLGQASQFAGDTESAIAAYEQFLELSPEDPNAELVRQQLDQLRATQPSG